MVALKDGEGGVATLRDGEGGVATLREVWPH